MSVKKFIQYYGHEFSIYFTAGALILAAYLVIVKLMPIVLSCRVVLK